MTLEQALLLAKGIDSNRPSIGEALCIIDRMLDTAGFNWITGKRAFEVLRAEFDVQSGADKAAAIHAAPTWERKLYKWAFPKTSFKRFWDQFGRRGEQRVARSIFAGKP